MMRFIKKHWMEILMAILLIIVVLSFTRGVFGQEQAAPPAKGEKVKAWKLPTYMHENLQWMLKDFNNRLQEKIDLYENELRTHFAKFKDMPEDMVLDIEGGIFIERSDYLMLQEQLKRRMIEEQIKKEVRENEKQIN